MAALTEDVKIALVVALACYDTPTQAAQAVKEEFGVHVTRAQAGKYDPSKPGGQTLGKKLREIFDATRAEFLSEVAAIPIANQAYRLRLLQRAVERADSKGNSPMVAQLLEQAAREVGGAFTNRREVTGKDGKPIAMAHATVTKEELAQAVRSVREEF